MKRAYPKYKETDIPWLPEMPEGWIVKQLGRLGKFYKGKGISRSDLTNDGVPAILYGDIYTQYDIKAEDIVNKIPKTLASAALKLSKGDILFAASGETVDDIGKTIVMLSESPVYCGGDVIVLTNIDDDSIYLSYLLNCSFLKFEKSRRSKGEIIVHLYASRINNIKLPLPPLPDQRAIAAFLDHKCALIDTFIQKKTRLIELLKEQKQALINRAVTRGLDPDVPLKPSGIEWLGDIPAHWEVKKLKYLVEKVGSGVTPKGGAAVYVSEGIPILRSQNIYSDRFELSEVAYITREVHDSMANSKVKNGDVLLNITGGSIGRCYYFDNQFEEANVNQHVCIIRPNDKITTQYLHLLVISEIGHVQIWKEQTGSGREGLNFEAIKNFFLALPDVSEQRKIENYLYAEFGKLNLIISRITREIDLIKEYKSALIAEAVTGGIDVREWLNKDEAG